MRARITSFAAAILALAGCNGEPTGPPKVSELRVAQVTAAGKRTSFESYDFVCPSLPASNPGSVTQTGNTLHVRDVINYSYHVSSNPLVEGLLTVWVSANVNLSNGAGDFAGTLELAPAILDGTGSWVGSFGGHFKGGKFEGNPLTLVDSHMVAHGTGVLEGQSITFDHLVNLAFEHPDGPDGCTFDGELFKGFIFDPRG
jgi:hypothetical protein